MSANASTPSKGTERTKKKGKVELSTLDGSVSQYDQISEQQMDKIFSFIQGHVGDKMSNGILGTKSADYCRGYRLRKAVLSEEFKKKFKFPANLEVAVEREFAENLLTVMMRRQSDDEMPRYFVPCRKFEESTRPKSHLQIMQRSTGFGKYMEEGTKKSKKENKGGKKGGKLEDQLYLITFEVQKTRLIWLVLLIIGFLLACLFPVWPSFMKTGVWYLAVTFLILMVGFTIFRYLVFIVCWVCGYHFWILPNFFEEEATVLQSLYPIYTFEKGDTDAGSWIFRIVVFGLLTSASYWVYIQPPKEHADFMKGVESFADDLYSGKLLSDMAHKETEDVDIGSLDITFNEPTTLEDAESVFQSFDLNNDEVLDATELESIKNETVETLDKDGNTQLSFNEYRALFDFEDDVDPEVDELLEQILKEEEEDLPEIPEESEPVEQKKEQTEL